MSLIRILFRRQTYAPMLAVVFASAVCLALVVARIIWTRRVGDYAFLGWNLFLAWLPLVFALLANEAYACRRGRPWRFAGWSAAWLLFFPNAPYICTDVIHLTARFHNHFWIDLVLVLCHALTGMVLGFLSLYLMQNLVARKFGKAASWVFIAAVAGLSGFGIYLGRFLRFNSWDVLVQPFALGRSLARWAADPFAHSHAYAFPVLFATFLFISYLMLYALTHLQPAHQISTAADEPA